MFICCNNMMYSELFWIYSSRFCCYRCCCCLYQKREEKFVTKVSFLSFLFYCSFSSLLLFLFVFHSTFRNRLELARRKNYYSRYYNYCYYCYYFHYNHYVYLRDIKRKSVPIANSAPPPNA